MKKIGCIFWLSKQQPTAAKIQGIFGCIAVAILLAMTSIAVAQNPTPAAPEPSPEARIVTPDGYTIHQSVDIGGRITNQAGSKAMYDTLVNLQTGPRVLGETFEMRALPGKKHTLVDSITAFGSGFGGDPYNFAKLNASKGKVYEFSGLFRRDRQYFDYDLLGNANIPSGQTIATGPSNAPTGSFAWAQQMQSPFMFNTVRRMTDVNLTVFPLAKVTYRFAYSQNVFQGPSTTPAGYSISKYDALLEEFQRNSTDDFTGAIDWKPLERTKITFEEQIDHYKGDSYFVLAPSSYNVQEADGTPVALTNYDSQTPYSPASACNSNSVGAAPVTYFTAAQTPGGLPIINPACSVVTSYQRTAPTRVLFPTEILRFQSSSIKNVTMNGDFRYTNANMNMPNYYDSVQELNGTTRSIAYTAKGSAKREVVAFDYGVVWQAMSKFALSDQLSYSDVHQPGTTTMLTGLKLATPATAGNETINYAGALVSTVYAAGASTFTGGGNIGTPVPGYLGLKNFTNNVTGTWDPISRATFSVTYRYGTRLIGQGSPDNAPLAVAATTNGTVSITENGGIFNAALRPTNNWDVNGTVEVLYDDNVLTPLGARQTKHYRVHTLYKPKRWATLTGAFNDLERHNNTNNNQSAVALFTPPSATPPPNGTASTGTPYEGPLDHVDHSRIVSVGAVLAPNEHYGLEVNYAYSDVYTATNICYLNGATATLPGAVQSATSTACPNIFGRGATGVTETNGTALTDWFARDFVDAPTQTASVALNLSPIHSVHSNIGYRISSVNGSQFFNDARSVNGSLDSTYQTPYVNVAWTMHPGLVWRVEYNYYGYGEGGASGSQYCSTSTSGTATPVLCTSLPYQTGLTESPAGETAPRNFHSNNLLLAVHYDF